MFTDDQPNDIQTGPPSADPRVQPPEISVVVTAHNEAERIAACLSAIAKQDYPMERVEIILVDDRSTDDTVERARTLGISGLRVLRLDEPPANLTARQAALHLGITEARGEIIMITDAGGRVPREWIRELTDHLAYRDGAVTGPVIFAGPGHAFNRFQTLDALVKMSFFDWANRRGLASGLYGANLALRRQAYLETGGFPVIGFAPAEDFALGAALHRTGWDIRYLTRPTVFNPTCRNLFGLVGRTRRRTRNGPPALTALNLGLSLTNLLLVALAVFGHGIWLVILAARYLAGLLAVTVTLLRYGSMQINRWVFIFEPLMTMLTLWAYLSNRIRPVWRWGGIRYGRNGPLEITDPAGSQT
jgi:cellulose synthase/poly-beta-1,6-N-acetylglucosamine synthase-like glycosyltransferase